MMMGRILMVDGVKVQNKRMSDPLARLYRMPSSQTTIRQMRHDGAY